MIGRVRCRLYRLDGSKFDMQTQAIANPRLQYAVICSHNILPHLETLLPNDQYVLLCQLFDEIVLFQGIPIHLGVGTSTLWSHKYRVTKSCIFILNWVVNYWITNYESPTDFLMPSVLVIRKKHSSSRCLTSLLFTCI